MAATDRILTPNPLTTGATDPYRLTQRDIGRKGYVQVNITGNFGGGTVYLEGNRGDDLNAPAEWVALGDLAQATAPQAILLDLDSLANFDDDASRGYYIRARIDGATGASVTVALI